MDTYQPCLTAFARLRRGILCLCRAGETESLGQEVPGSGFSLSHGLMLGKLPCSHLQKCFGPQSAGFKASFPTPTISQVRLQPGDFSLQVMSNSLQPHGLQHASLP